MHPYYIGAGNEIRTRDFNLGKVALYRWTIPAYLFNGGTNRARTCDPLLVRQVLSQLSYGPGIIKWSGWRGSNPHSRLGRPELYHWATPAWWLIGESNPCYRRERAVSWPLDQWAILFKWLRRQDLNLWPSGYEPDELPTAPLRDIKVGAEDRNRTGTKV